MPCDKYKEALIETAASGAALRISLREHVDACVHCSATLAAQQTLFAAVDSSIRRSANAELPDAFLLGVRSRLTAERISERSWSPAWAAIAASAALIIGTVMVTRDRHSGAVLNVKQTSPNGGVLPYPKEETFSKDSPKVPFEQIRGERHQSQVSQYPDQTGDPRPIVPVRNQQATDQLIGGVARGEINGDVLVRSAHMAEIEDLQIPRIVITTIAERLPEDAKSGSSDTPEARTPETSIDADRRTK
jgi:hypothetical protein